MGTEVESMIKRRVTGRISGLHNGVGGKEPTSVMRIRPKRRMQAEGKAAGFTRHPGVSRRLSYSSRCEDKALIGYHHLFFGVRSVYIFGNGAYGIVYYYLLNTKRCARINRMCVYS